MKFLLLLVSNVNFKEFIKDKLVILSLFEARAWKERSMA